MRFIPFITISVTFVVLSLALDAAAHAASLNNPNDVEVSDVLRLLCGEEGEERALFENKAPSGGVNSSSTAAAASRTSTTTSRNLRSGKKRRTENNSNVRYRIVGGTDVKAQEDYPFFAELSMGCGASLISENVLLTAAHCLSYALSESVRLDRNVWVGSHVTGDGVHSSFDGVAIHPNWGRLGSDNVMDDLRYDFALLSLKEPISGRTHRNDGGNNNNVAAAAVQLNRISTYPSEPDASLTVIGFGQTTYHGSSANRLQELKVPFVPHKKCAEIYANPSASIPIDEHSMLCAGGAKDEDSCLGDSGGPILDADGVQVGVVSFGSPCGVEGWPGVYSRVSSAIGWINDFVCANSLSTDRIPETCISDDQQQRFRIQLEIDHDDQPQETSWNINLRDTGTNVITVPKVDYQNNNNGKYTRGVNLIPGRYSFQIEDSEGEGIRGENHNYRLTTTAATGTTNSTTIERDGAFGYHDFVNFEITETGELRNSLLPYYGDQNQIRIDIMYDDHPNETAWALLNRDTKKRVHVSKRGSVTSSGLVSVPLEVPDGNYWLLMIDSSGDGICCNYGRGSIEVTMVVNGVDVERASHRGSFQRVVDMDFSVP